MAHVDLLIRARQEADLWTLNALLPEQFQLFDTGDNSPKPGISYVTQGLNPLVLTPDLDPGDVGYETSPWFHANIRVGPPLLDGIKLPDADPDTDTDRNLFRRHLRQNGTTRNDPTSDHPRTGTTTFGWYRWESGAAWVEITQAKPGQRRGIWFGDPASPDV